MRVLGEQHSRPQPATLLRVSRSTRDAIHARAAAGTVRTDAVAQGTLGAGHDFSRIPVHAPVLQARLAVNAPGDRWEQEAERIASRVASVPQAQPGHACACGGTCPRCRQKATEHAHRHGMGQVQAARVPGGDTEAVAAPPIVDEVRSSPGQPLAPSARAFMEPRLGHDFGRVRVHADGRAADAARAVGARAFTVGHDIVFGAGEYTPGSPEGRRLLAHELVHVVQQSAPGGAPAVQRDTFGGGPGTTAKDVDRPLTGYEGPMQHQPSPGGTVIPGTAGRGQNCAGDSCSMNRWINWPHLGIEVPGVATGADWALANNFVPSGCTRVNCSGVDVHNTRCQRSELELIAFLYRWPMTVSINGVPTAATQSDFHMIGRDAGGLPRGWHSKMDQRERVEDIRSPVQSLYDAYPHTRLPNRTISQLCFCCNQAAITAS
ncbi:MAG TPA: DUF4157 domain-containing protein [Longimicrobium sp.]|nr:DUF4157 domain-containing protein [Longimicrobium sp.]